MGYDNILKTDIAWKTTEEDKLIETKNLETNANVNMEYSIWMTTDFLYDR